MRRTQLKRRAPLRTTKRLRRTTAPRRGGRLVRRAPLVRARVAPASDAQRAKVAGRRCLVCGRATRVDPAHLIPRSLGGCDEPDCVVGLCRPCHRQYDSGALDLVPYLEPDHRSEVAHAVIHVGLVGALRRLAGSRDTDAADTPNGGATILREASVMTEHDTMLRVGDERWQALAEEERERRRRDADVPVPELLRRGIHLSRVAMGLRRAVEEAEDAKSRP